MNLNEELERIKLDAEEKIKALRKIELQIKKEDKKIDSITKTLSDSFGDSVVAEEIKKFFKKPYVVINRGKDKALVIVPKFIKDFEVGWLWKETESFFIYQFDKYSSWLSDAPEDLLEEINFKKELDVYQEGNTIQFEKGQKDLIKQKLGKHIKDITETEATILKNHHFDILVEIIESGCLPFKQKRISPSDIREPRSKIELRKYQKKVFDKFMECGAVGVFHPTGAGKSFIALYCMDIIKGRKLVVVPTRTLVEQWNYLIETYLPHAKDEIEVKTYQGFRDNNEEYALVIYDECQRLPADTFSRLAVVNTKYRLGLSASPHREDGRESYIFALTGFPMGLNWREYMETVGKSYHPIYVHITQGESHKINKLMKILNPKKKTIIFCDTIELGKRIASELNVPYIYGQSINRLEEIKNNKVFVASRVLDLGVSIKDLNRIIEVDFLFGSRQQEIQRTGRLMHSEVGEQHDIIMTKKEYEAYGKRLWALQEKGFTVKIKQ